MRSVIYILLPGLIFLCGCGQKETKAPLDTPSGITAKEVEQKRAVQTKAIASGTEGRTPSGYRYKFHHSTNGIKPQIGDQVRYHEIIFKNDSLVSSTYYQFEPTLALIPSLAEIPNPPPPNFEGVMMMSPGDSLSVWHDLDTVSTANLPKWLRNTDKLRYDMKMVSHQPKSAIEEGINATKARVKSVGDSLRMAIVDFRAGKLDKLFTKTKSGLSYYIHEEGSGPQIEEGKYLQVHYMGMLQETGSSFNNTFGMAKPFAFQVGRGRVIKGWDEALLKLKKGGKMTLFIPYQMGYGEAGRPGKKGEPAYIPERSDLVFYVEILDIR